MKWFRDLLSLIRDLVYFMFVPPEDYDVDEADAVAYYLESEDEDSFF